MPNVFMIWWKDYKNDKDKLFFTLLYETTYALIAAEVFMGILSYREKLILTTCRVNADNVDISKC